MSLKLALLGVLLTLSSGCAFLLPKTQNYTKTRWTRYDDAKAAFDGIAIGQTATNTLAALGFDPSVNANVRILSYIDVTRRFMPNQSISKDDLDPAVRAFIERYEEGEGWEVELNSSNAKRYGNAFLDVTGFLKKTHEKGWRFKGLLLVHEGRVVYKIASGEPSIDRYDKKSQPLGPFQELDNVVFRAAGR